MSSASKIIQAAAGNAGEALYVEDVFSTYLYEGDGSTQTITNGIDLDGEGGLVWIKNRDAGDSHVLTDTERGATEILSSDSTAAEATDADTLTGFNSDGFAIGADVKVNTNTEDYASWTFRKAPKFFDVVTYTGNRTTGHQVAHNLGVAPHVVIVKKTNSTGSWFVWFKDITASDEWLTLNGTGSIGGGSGVDVWGTHTDAHFVVGDNSLNNDTGDSYVAYLFAHNNGDGEFGDDGDQDIIKCGSYTGNGSSDGPEIDLGFEPQWVLIKNADIVQNWYVIDNMRGMAVNVTNGDATLLPNTNGSENTANIISPLPDGFKITASNSQYNGSGNNIIYIAIRRGPMKTPESGTEVFAVTTKDANEPAWNSGFPVDLAWTRNVPFVASWNFATRLTQGKALVPNDTIAEFDNASHVFDYMDGWSSNTGTNSTFYSWMFRRAPGFFDVVAYEGDGASSQTIQHNLGVAPELIIGKGRSFTSDWPVYYGSGLNNVFVNLAQAQTGLGAYFETGSAFTAISSTTQFDVSLLTGGNATKSMNTASEDYILYLFATVPGVSKIGSFSITESGGDVTVDCGFTNGARFILLKSVNTSSGWLVFDTARGIVSGTFPSGIDPYIPLNTTDDEESTLDAISPTSSGFIARVGNDQLVPGIIPDNSTVIFLAIA